MATAQQVEANRANAQFSSGPQSEAGKQKSALNATRHGFTGQTLLLSAEEKEAYENHCIAYLEKYSPSTHEETSLVQQSADLNWSLHQIFVQQAGLMTVISTISAKLMAEGDFDGLIAKTTQLQKSLATLSIYETRKRRAADQVEAELTALLEAKREALAKAAALSKALKSQGKPFNPTEFGFVCSSKEIDSYLRLQDSQAEAKKLLSQRT